jgi:hypothetical protein
MFSAQRFCVLVLFLACVLVLTPDYASAGKQFVLPVAQPANSYPARDQHSDEHVSVALDPYDLADKAGIFTIHFSDVGFLPIFVVIQNDGDQPLSLTTMKAEFVTVNRVKIAPATNDDIYRRLNHPSTSGRPSPLPFPTKKIKGTVSQQTQDEIQHAQFAARAVEPHSTQSGFMFFDVSGISSPLAGAHFYLTGVNDAKGNELLYFDVPLENYLSAPAKP